MKDKKPGFKITDSKGFHITFENGVTVSVQFGWGNYCRDYPVNEGPKNFDNYREWNKELGEKGSPNAEIAIFDNDGKWLTRKYIEQSQNKNESDDVLGWQTPDNVLDALKWAASYESQPPTDKELNQSPKE